MSPSPQDTVPTPVSAAAPLRPRCEHAPARVVAVAALTIFDQQGVFSIIVSDSTLFSCGDLIRFRRGSRLHQSALPEARQP